MKMQKEKIAKKIERFKNIFKLIAKYEITA